MKIKHNKYKNTGILFELLVRKITADTLSSGNSKAASLVKKYFTKNKLMKSYLYSSMSGQVQIKFLSPWALSTLPTVGQYL